MKVYAPLSDQDVLSVQEFASLFKMSESAVRRGIERGDIPGQKIGKLYRAYVAATREISADERDGA